MKEPVVIIWGVFAIISGLCLKWCMKNNQRQFDALTPIHLLAFVLVSSAVGCVLQFLFQNSPTHVWASRLAFLVLGALQVWSLYGQAWVKRDKYDYEKDSLATELAFTLVLAFVCSIGFAWSPKLLGFLKLAPPTSGLTMWDAPVVFLLPFLLLKLTDFSGQIPFRLVENLWVYPLEPFIADPSKWRDLTQVNFQLARSVGDEYRFFARPAGAWIQAPQAEKLGNVFRLVMQERRKHPELPEIQDLGSEYDNASKFWWLFSIKIIWWKPSTWQRARRYLDPDASIAANSVSSGDVVLARRIPADGVLAPGTRLSSQQGEFDSEKTVIISR